MSDSPIFRQLVTEFAAKGAVYEEFVRFTTPEFVWDPSRPVVQLDKRSKGKGLNFDKTAMVEVWKPQPSMDDSTLSLVVEGLHPTVKPLSERNTA